MGESIHQKNNLQEFNNLLSLFRVYQDDIEKIRQARTLLKEPLDLSIDLTPVDPNDTDALLQAVRNYENSLHQGAQDPLIFGFKKLFQGTYRELEHFLLNGSFNDKEKEELNDMLNESRTHTQLDDLLTYLITSLQNYTGERNV